MENNFTLSTLNTKNQSMNSKKAKHRSTHFFKINMPSEHPHRIRNNSVDNIIKYLTNI